MKKDKNLLEEFNIQKKIAYTAGLLQGDVTIKTLLESLAEGVLIINDEGRVVLINSRFSNMTGYNKTQIMGMSMNIFLKSDMHEKHDSHIKHFFKTPRIRPMGIGVELEVVRKDGSTFPVEISLSYLSTDIGKLGIGFITDITARKHAEQELLARNKELDSFAKTVAHDLNSSLAGMINMSELLANPKKEISDKKKTEYLQKIADRGRRMSNVIKEILFLTSVKKKDLQLEKVNIKLVLDHVIERLNYQIEKNNAKVFIDKDIEDCWGYGSWIEEVFFNFISNALNYSDNEPIIKIKSKLGSDDFIRYMVIDNGIGIKQELLEDIFEESSPLKKKHIKGFGLGLNIVKRIIEKLDGRLSVESEIGKGSCFSFFLPKL